MSNEEKKENQEQETEKKQNTEEKIEIKEEEKKAEKRLILSNAPHVKSGQSLSKIMWLVVAALTPSFIYSAYIFGFSACILVLSAVLAAVASEAVYQYLMKKPITVTDGSAVITGMLVAMNVPPEAPVWMTVIGSVFAVVIAKQLFGGLGFNIFNPALAARAFMLASWPVEMTTTWHKFDSANIFSNSLEKISCMPQAAFDVISQATPLAALKQAPALLKDLNTTTDCFHQQIFSSSVFKALFMGNIGGVIGETSALLLLIGGLFLLFKKIITWHIPVSFIGTVAGIMLLYYSATGTADPFKGTLFHVLSGGLFLGAFFMATDMVTSPETAKGMIIFGIGCGVITSVIRLWGGYPEGVSYSILLMNAAVPLIDRYTKPKVFGTSNK